MKTIAKRILSLAIVVCMAFIGVFVTPVVKADAATNYVETSFGEGKLLITTTYDGTNKYYLPTQQVSSKPKAESLDLSKVTEDNLWTITKTTGGYYIQNSDNKYLNSGSSTTIRIDDNKAVWVYDETNNTLTNTSNDRLLGVYNAQDWRGYASSGTGGFKNSHTAFKFYKVATAEPETPAVTTINDVESYMSLAYQYSANMESSQIEGYKLVTDVNDLKAGDKVIIAAKDYNYAMSTEQKSNNRGQTAITKSENMLDTPSDTVQVLTLNAGTQAGTFAFYTGSGYLYAASSSNNYLKTGTLNDNASWSISIADTGVATVKAQGTNTRNVMQYNQSSGLFACYSSASQQAIVLYKLDTITADVTTINGVSGEFRIRCAVDSSLAKVEGAVEGSYGIQVTANGKTVNYNKDSASWTVEEDVFYVVIDLGDILNDEDKLNTEFTVAAYNGNDVNTTKTKTYSVVSMIKEYYETLKIDEVEDLYNYFVEEGLI